MFELTDREKENLGASYAKDFESDIAMGADRFITWKGREEANFIFDKIRCILPKSVKERFPAAQWVCTLNVLKELQAPEANRTKYIYYFTKDHVWNRKSAGEFLTRERMRTGKSRAEIMDEHADKMGEVVYTTVSENACRPNGRENWDQLTALLGENLVVLGRKSRCGHYPILGYVPTRTVYTYD